MTFSIDNATKHGSSGFDIAIDNINSERPYLGDPEVVARLVRNLVAASSSRIGAVSDGELEHVLAIAHDHKDMLQLADILSGTNDAYQAVGDWNPHGLAAAIRAHFTGSIDEQAAANDKDAVQQACAALLLQVYQVMSKLMQDGDEDDAKLSIEGVIGDFTNLFAGLPLDRHSPMRAQSCP